MKRFDIKVAICSSISLALLWFLTRFSVFYSTLNPSLTDALAGKDYASQLFPVYMLFICLVAVACLFYYNEIGKVFIASKATAGFCAGGAFAGIGLSLSSVYFSHTPEFLISVGISLAGVFVALLFVLWFVKLLQEPATVATVYLAITICVICVFLAVVAIFPQVAAVICLVAPIAAAVLYYVAGGQENAAELENETASLRKLNWRYLVPVVLLLSLAHVFNKLISPVSSALIGAYSRLLTDAITILLFVALLVCLRKHYLTADLAPKLFLVAVVVLLLGLLAIIVWPTKGETVGGAILMASMYCFVFLTGALLIRDHVRSKISPVQLTGVFLLASVVFPLAIANTFVYEYAAVLQARGTAYSMTMAAVLSFLVAVAAFVSISMQTMQEKEKIQDPEVRIKRLCEKVARDFGLSSRETEVLVLLYKGRSRKAISETLVIAPATTQGHINHIYQKMDIHKRDELIDYIDNYQPNKTN